MPFIFQKFSKRSGGAPRSSTSSRQRRPSRKTRHYGTLVAGDGGLVVGKGKGRRTIEGCKYWKLDDEERNKRRKSMLANQWRGR